MKKHFAIFGVALAIALLVLLLMFQPQYDPQTEPPKGRVYGLLDPPGWTVGSQAVNYTAAHTIGDGTTAQGGTAPAYAYELADIASNFSTAQWTSSTPSFIVSGGDNKFRTTCAPSHEAQEDPMLFPGQANAGHLHTFFGNTLAGRNSDYTSLRTTGQSTCGGGPLNRTGYWHPSMRKTLSSGVTASLKPDYYILYYTTGATANAAKMTRIPRGFRYILGFNPADPNDTQTTDKIAALNATTPGSYVYISNGFRGWACDAPAAGNGSIATSPVAGSQFQPYLRNADLTPTLNCAPNSKIYAAFDAPTCWDGINLASPNQRDHIRQEIRDASSGQPVCPDGWYRLPPFQLKIVFSQTGQADYTSWFASSDRMPGMTQFLNGQSMHTDWFGAWDYGTEAAPGVMINWMNQCTGIKIGSLASDPHACDYSTFNATTRLLSDSPSPDGSLPNPIVALSNNFAAGQQKNRYWPLKAGTKGPLIVHGRH